MNYYRRYIGDYGKKTPLLSLAEHGAYSLMLDHYYAEEAPLPADREEIYRLARCTRSDERKAVDRVLKKYFTEEPDGFHNARADEELKRAKPAIDAAKGNGAKGGRPSKINPPGSSEETHRVIASDNPPGSVQEPTGKAIRGGDPTTNHHPPTATPQPPGTADAAAPPAPAKRSATNGDKAPAKSAGAWEAYREAYWRRYGSEPVENAKVRSLLCQLVDRLGPREAPEVAAFFVRHNGSWYVQNMHQVDWLVKDAEKLRTEWATGATMTSTKARQTDKTAANAGVWGTLIAEAEANERIVDEQ